MRPLTLLLDHFGSFRDPVTIDFTEIEYFALVGPTGAGKSTVIDAICFALYGTVPRWGKENVISHALAPSVASGKVGLVFDSGGRRYGVVRALVRDAKGVVRTKEARLDELKPGATTFDEVLKPVAEGEDVSREVQRVTGLEYRFFTQCVVLPQGRFAEFLHAAPRERQDLLVQLLDADVYERIRQRAVREEEQAKQAASFARDQLGKLAEATPQLEEELSQQVLALRKLADGIGADLELLRARDAEIKRANETLAGLEQRIKQLRALVMPGEVPTLATAAREAADAVAELVERVAHAEAEEHAAEEGLTALADRAALLAVLSGIDTHERLTRAAQSARDSAAQAAADPPRLAKALATHRERLGKAEAALSRLRDAHAGAGLAARLAVGEPCPVCLRAVADLPHHSSLADLGTAEQAVLLARGDADQAAAAHSKAEATAAALAEQAAKLDRELSLQAPAAEPREAIEARLAAVSQAEKQVTAARAATRARRTELARARERAGQVAGQADNAWRALEAARDQLLSLGQHGETPPPIDRDDLHRAWIDLIGWRDQAGFATRDTITEVRGTLDTVTGQRAQERAKLGERLLEHGVVSPRDATPDQLSAVVAGSLARVEGALERVREDRRRAADLEVRIAAQELEAKVAHELTLRLRANAFERWLCAEALSILVATASDTLRELSDGQYELALSDRSDIEVIDYAEAGMRRSARTLSGGETFQAALALALALSGTVARNLDSIFLDEGFGTLDPATLDTVATTLEKLAAGQERMVGVVTHVPALADRIPFRFEVSRDAAGSRVRRVGP